jgi:hypothetical protein
VKEKKNEPSLADFPLLAKSVPVTAVRAGDDERLDLITTSGRKIPLRIYQ